MKKYAIRIPSMIQFEFKSGLRLPADNLVFLDERNPVVVLAKQMFPVSYLDGLRIFIGNMGGNTVSLPIGKELEMLATTPIWQSVSYGSSMTLVGQDPILIASIAESISLEMLIRPMESLSRVQQLCWEHEGLLVALHYEPLETGSVVKGFYS